MMFYTTVGGWMMYYCYRSIKGEFVGATSDMVAIAPIPIERVKNAWLIAPKITFPIPISFIPVVALMAGFIIIPSCFAFGIEPGAGPSLIFITIPNIFAQMTGGRLWGALFFIPAKSGTR